MSQRFLTQYTNVNVEQVKLSRSGSDRAIANFRLSVSQPNEGKFLGLCL